VHNIFRVQPFTSTHLYLERHVSKENLWALQVSLRALISQPMCMSTCAQLRGNIGADKQLNKHLG